MDFFEHQDLARKRTGQLVALFILAVIAIILAVYGAMVAVLMFTGGAETARAVVWWDPQLLAVTVATTSVLVATGTCYKLAVLSTGGGRSVAEMLGGRLIPPDTVDPHERRVINVVEEMAIASGTPVPSVYLLEDEGAINAFAAGFSPGDAVIGVTRGCTRLLNRDELQGAIAHEFSHILNGDMRLNLRLIGFLHGILLIGLAGYWILRASGRVRFSSRRGKSGGGQAVILLVGLALLVIGYVGVFFGQLIKIAVSRQREFLADASAVQFTRHPEGIAGALKKIGGLSQGSRLESPHGREASHMFFANALGVSMLGLLSTHPPLKERVRRIDPTFDGQFPHAVVPVPDDEGQKSAPARTADGRRVDPISVMSHIGAPRFEHLIYAAESLTAIADPLAQATRNAFSAQAVVYALLLGQEGHVHARQLQELQAHADTPVIELTQQLFDMLCREPTPMRMPLAEMALTGLQGMSDRQYERFKSCVRALIEADRNVTLFEYALHRMIRRHLAVRFERIRPVAVRYHRLEPVVESCVQLLSVLAHIGHGEETTAQKAFAKAVGVLQLTGDRPPRLLPKALADLHMLDKALYCLERTAPRIKKRILQACMVCMVWDKQVTVREHETLRAIGDALDCPIPPYVDNVEEHRTTS